MTFNRSWHQFYLCTWLYKMYI